MRQPVVQRYGPEGIVVQLKKCIRHTITGLDHQVKFKTEVRKKSARLSRAILSNHARCDLASMAKGAPCPKPNASFGDPEVLV
jgi:hypothetical protein